MIARLESPSLTPTSCCVSSHSYHCLSAASDLVEIPISDTTLRGLLIIFHLSVQPCICHLLVQKCKCCTSFYIWLHYLIIPHLFLLLTVLVCDFPKAGGPCPAGEPYPLQPPAPRPTNHLLGPATCWAGGPGGKPVVQPGWRGWSMCQAGGPGKELVAELLVQPDRRG